MAVDERDEVRLERPAQQVWEAAQQLLKKRMSVAAYSSWIEPLQLQKIEADVAVFAVANDMARSWVTSFQNDICSSLSEVTGTSVTLRVVIDPEQAPKNYSGSIASIAVVPSSQSRDSRESDAEFRNQATNLNPKYTLDNLVVGSHNRFVHSAAMAVAQRPGESYNPLFIYGGVGLGKTHLMQAIGHHVLMNNPKLAVRYITCERFTNDLINSIQGNSMVSFRKRYRQVDVLLVDDVHFIAGKESTQEEFFHTFNAIRDSNKQIVLSSDRPPKELQKLEERLRSRFEWGLIADIQAPDLETRVAILRKKSLLEGMIVPDDVLEYIAASFTNNIRELEGALLRVKAYANLMGDSLNLSTVANVLQIGTPNPSKNTLSFENILGAVAAHYRVDTSDLRSKKRSQDIAFPRHVAIYLAHEMLSMSHSRIGECIGDIAHSSVIHAINKIKAKLEVDPQLKASIHELRRQLSN